MVSLWAYANGCHDAAKTGPAAATQRPNCRFCSIHVTIDILLPFLGKCREIYHTWMLWVTMKHHETHTSGSFHSVVGFKETMMPKIAKKTIGISLEENDAWHFKASCF